MRRRRNPEPLASRHGLEIRAATPADAPALAELMEIVRPDAPAALLARRLEAFRDEPGVALLASEWGPPSGLIVLHWLSPLQSARIALVSLLLVAPDARRRGIGRVLLKAAAQAGRTAGCDVLRCPVTREASGLDAFCRATGFDDAGAAWERSLRKGPGRARLDRPGPDPP